MGFWTGVREFFSHPIQTLFGSGDEPPTIGGEPEGDTGEIEGVDVPISGPEMAYDWQLAGYQDAGKDYTGGHHNLDPDSPQTRLSIEGFSGWDFLPEADYVVVKVYIQGEAIYVTLAGPFDDLEDLEHAIADWYESGS